MEVVSSSPMQLFIYIYTGMFHTQGAWVHIAQSCWEPKQDEASSFPKKKKKKTDAKKETDEGNHTRGKVWDEL